MEWQGQVVETLHVLCKYTVEAHSREEAITLLEEGETIEEEALGTTEVVHRELVEGSLKRKKES